MGWAALTTVVVTLACTTAQRSADSVATPSASASPTVAAQPSPTASETTAATVEPTPSESASEPAARATPPPPSRPNLARVDVRLKRVANIADPTAFAVRPGDDGLYVTERDGRVLVVRNGKTKAVLDLRHRTLAGGERGMLGLAFSPDGDHAYVYYMGKPDEHSHLDVFRVDDRGFDRRSRRRVLLVRQPPHNVHKGGQLAFGPDRNLYLALGDGGPSDEPPNTSQRLDTLLGKLIRIRPTPEAAKPYAVAKSNPFVKRRRARPEIFALGLRNPWRFSFDRQTGDLWVADVGRYVQEEINVVGPRTAAGANFGWPFYEGTSQRESGAPQDVVAPLHVYLHEDRCAVVGGFVYRGTAIPRLRGAYVYGDHCDGRVRALVQRRGKVVADRPLGPRVEGLTSFGEDADGELYVLSLTKGLLRLQ